MKNGTFYEDLSVIFKRSKILFVVVQALFIILILFFWKIQILDHQKYWVKSEDNRTREIVLSPQRGLIYDRDGELLATNIASFKVSLVKENCRDFDESIQRISRLIDLEPEVILERLEKYKTQPEFRPVVIKDNLSNEEVARIEVQKVEFPELIIQSEPKRYYPRGSFGSHVLGYLQEVSDEEIRNDSFPGRRLGDLVGKTGIEWVYDSQMEGTEGRLLEIVDSTGRIEGELARQKPSPGENITLTLDSELQLKAEELLEGREGAIVVMNVESGEILALASYPSFDPNKFINRFTPDEWQELANNPENPLQNRAIRGLYSPGSIFKITMAIAGLELRMINDNTNVTCFGETIIYGHPFRCWYEPGHGPLNLFGALQHSCNIYFYQLGKKLSIDSIAKYARMLGFERKTGIDLPGEYSGLIPDTEWKKKARNEPWYPGETISVSIGQGPIQVTPLQICYHTSIIANRGKRVIPHLVNSRADYNLPPIELPRSTFERVIRGMWLSSNQQGTSQAARIDGFDVCGKTGSTQTISRETAEKLAEQKIEVSTHAWFSGFAPRDNPKIAVTVIIEYGGGGGAAAAPVAGELFKKYREKYD
ncbi:penicillin-binding protein 2 [Acidobacteriota bacterium]